MGILGQTSYEVSTGPGGQLPASLRRRAWASVTDASNVHGESRRRTHRRSETSGRCTEPLEFDDGEPVVDGDCCGRTRVVVPSEEHKGKVVHQQLS